MTPEEFCDSLFGESYFQGSEPGIQGTEQAPMQAAYVSSE